ncbi:MAG TPA: c-type cytochrome [Chitinophagaceae bacterium]|nr:c-type cytochrome [Chitinophagaceae bacterium]
MRKILKWTGIVIVVVITGFSAVVALMQSKKYDAPYPDIHASADSAVIARGRYLVSGPAHCADCHAPDSLYKLANQGQVVNLIGGREFKLPIGTLRSPNLTPDKQTGLGNWQDKVIARSLRYGVGYDGRALFAFMPFQNLSDDDLTAIISYLRTLPPVHNPVQVRSLNPMGYIAKAFFIRPVGPDGTPPKSVSADTTVAYGKYVADNIANCRGCHTNRDLKTGAFIGKFFAGGFHIESVIDPDHYECVTPNISPDPKTGHIIGWTEAYFINRFRQGKIIPHSAMPWGPFKNMSDVELKAIYKYLQTVPPIENDPGPALIEKK